MNKEEEIRLRHFIYNYIPKGWTGTIAQLGLVPIKVDLDKDYPWYIRDAILEYLRIKISK